MLLVSNMNVWQVLSNSGWTWQRNLCDDILQTISVGKGNAAQMENTVTNWHVLFKKCLSAVVKLTLSAEQQIITFCGFSCMPGVATAHAIPGQSRGSSGMGWDGRSAASSKIDHQGSGQGCLPVSLKEKCCAESLNGIGLDQDWGILLFKLDNCCDWLSYWCSARIKSQNSLLHECFVWERQR